MKRNPALIPLSHFHRRILFLALIARKNAPAVKGYPETVEGKIDYALDFYQEQLIPHFRKEEKLWTYFGDRYKTIDALIGELRAERAQIHDMFTNLKSTKTRLQLEEIGPALERHVRREERELFQKIQEVASEEDMAWTESIVG